MTTKEIKSHLKAAKASIDAKRYEEAIGKCQMVFAIDANNYHAHVFAGLATLQLGKQQEAKQHYKSAINIAPKEQLAWKGMANLYDKGVGQEDLSDAIATYCKVVTFSEGDNDRQAELLKQVTTIASRMGGSCDQACVDACVSVAKSSKSEHTAVQAWCVLVTILKDSRALNKDWENLLVDGCELILSSQAVDKEQQISYHVIYINHLEKKFMGCRELSAAEEVKQKLQCYCDNMKAQLHSHPLPYVVTVKLLLGQCCAGYPILPSEELLTAADGLKMIEADNHLVILVNSLSLATESKNLMAAKENMSHRCIDDYCCYAVLATIYSKLHDAANTITACQKGLDLMNTCAVSLQNQVSRSLKLLMLSACLTNGDYTRSLEIITQLLLLFPTDPLVLARSVKVNTLTKDHDAAEKAHQQLTGVMDNGSTLVLTSAGLLHQSVKEYDRAIECFQQALENEPSSAECHLNLAQCLWDSPTGDKKRSHNLFLKAAKLDPYDSDTLTAIGDCYRPTNISNAKKCYQKALQLNPINARAGVSLGDCHMMDGDEVAAVELYRRVVTECSAINAKEAWLRLGLYQNSQQQYSDAIRSFLNCIHADLHNIYCWECLAEAYFSRGSYSNSLKAFGKALELDPSSLYCWYRSAFIKHKLSNFTAAIAEYSTVLQMDKNYFVALKGRGESYLSLARLSIEDNFDGRAVSYVCKALKDLTRAAQLRPRFVSIWKLIGDTCTCLNPIISLKDVMVPSILTGGSGEEKEIAIDKVKLLMIGTRAYKRAVELEPETAGLWYDVAISYLYTAQSVPVASANASECLQAAVNCLKKSVSLDPTSFVYWNALGVTTAYPGIENFSLAQHAFIKSIRVQQDNAMAWANLGVLYMRMDQIELAYKAFCNAQSADPSYVISWIGQALVAETMGRIEKMDLFSHSTELAYTSEGSMGFAYWVCHTLTTLQPKQILLNSGCGLNDAASKLLLLARDCMQKYTARHSNACAFNYLGLLYENEGLYHLSKQAFKQSLKLLEASTGSNNHQLNVVRENYARLSCCTREYTEAVKMYQQIQTMDTSYSWCGLGLAFSLNGNGQEAIKAYTQALQLCKNDSSLKSSVLTATALIHYTIGEKSKCKTCLFTAFQTPPPSLHCLTALAVFSCLTDDWSVFTATLAEILKLIEWQTDESAVPCSTEYILLTLHYVSIYVTKKGHPTAKKFCKEIDDICSKLKHEDHKLYNPVEAVGVITRETRKLVNAQSMYHSYPGDLWSLLVLSLSITSELKQRFIPLLKIHATDVLQVVQNHPKRVQELMRLFIISLHNWLEKM